MKRRFSSRKIFMKYYRLEMDTKPNRIHVGHADCSDRYCLRNEIAKIVSYC